MDSKWVVYSKQAQGVVIMAIPIIGAMFGWTIGPETMATVNNAIGALIALGGFGWTLYGLRVSDGVKLKLLP